MGESGDKEHERQCTDQRVITQQGRREIDQQIEEGTQNHNQCGVVGKGTFRQAEGILCVRERCREREEEIKCMRKSSCYLLLFRSINTLIENDLASIR